ncbi:hypothetical protein, partial [Kineococcus vitellinus]|uniref:hypothetical protein n=1 Tax=Kineococcus vitellinus TaxID=2696565 RepID=UPI00196B4ACE
MSEHYRGQLTSPMLETATGDAPPGGHPDQHPPHCRTGTRRRLQQIEHEQASRRAEELIHQPNVEQAIRVLQQWLAQAPLEGSAVEGSAVEGSAVEGSAVEGSAVEGSA